MREIKFRALELDTGRWVYGYYVAEHGYYMNNGVSDLNKPVVRHYIIGDSGKHDVCEETACQYTGLKDKKGVEIYEGDILLTDDGNFKVGYEAPSLYLVNVKGDLYMPDDDECPGFFSDTYDWGSFEVIGNIYENPELLKAPN